MGFFDSLLGRTKAVTDTSTQSGKARLQAKIVYLFTTQPLSDATTAQLGADMLENLPADTPIPDRCRTVPLQIQSGASRSQLEKILGSKAQKETGCTKSLCIVTRGTEANASEGFFIGF